MYKIVPMVSPEYVSEAILPLVEATNDPRAMVRSRTKALIELAQHPITRTSIFRGWSLFAELSAAQAELSSYRKMSQARKHRDSAIAIVSALTGSPLEWQVRVEARQHLDDWTGEESIFELSTDRYDNVARLKREMEWTCTKEELDSRFPWKGLTPSEIWIVDPGLESFE